VGGGGIPYKSDRDPCLCFLRAKIHGLVLLRVLKSDTTTARIILVPLRVGLIPGGTPYGRLSDKTPPPHPPKGEFFFKAQ